MSRFIKAFTDMMQGNSKNSHKKVTEPEKFHRSEFKNLIQQEIAPVKVSCYFFFPTPAFLSEEEREQEEPGWFPNSMWKHVPFKIKSTEEKF